MFYYYVLRHSINISVETMRIYCSFNPKGKHMKIVNAILEFFSAVGEASYAAHLARNQQWQRAQDMYRD